MRQLKYKGYTAQVEYNTEDQVFVGTVTAQDVISFHVELEGDIEVAFHTTIEDYIDFCRSRGIKQATAQGFDS